MVISPKFRQTLKRLVAATIVVVVALFFVRIVQQNWSVIHGNIHRPHVGWLGLGVLLVSGYYLFRIMVWQRALHFLGRRLGFREAGTTLMLSEVTRYVPGNIWSVLGRIGQSAAQGIPAADALYATVLEILALLLGSIITGGLLAVFATNLAPGIRFVALAGILGALAVSGLTPLLNKLVLWFMRKRGRAELQRHILPRELLTLVGFASVGWGLYAAGGFALMRSVLAVPGGAALLVLAALPLSWFIGYISFLTPSGLGIREATFAGLVASSLGAVGIVAAAVTRLGLTVVELLWVLIFAAGTVRRALQKTLQRMTQPKGVVILAVTIFALYFSIITVAMQTKVIRSRFDLGNMDQVVWNTAHGRFFTLTNPYATETVLRYIHHGDILLVLFAPLYWLYDSPNVLLVAQALLVSLGGWFVFRLARRVLGHDWLAAVLALAYLFYPTLQRAVMFDFHALTLAAPFAVGMVLAYIERRWVRFGIFAALLAMSKEELPLMVASVALLMLWRGWRELHIRKIAFATLALSVAYFSVTYFVIMPAARGGAVSKYVVQYDVLGTSPSEMLRTVAHNPRLLAAMLAGRQARHMYAGQLGPVGFLPFASPLWLAAAWPDYVVNLFNERIEPRLMIYHYQAAIGGFVFIATIFGIAAVRRRVGPWWDRTGRRVTKLSFDGLLIAYLLVITGVESYRLSPLPYSQTKDMRVFWPAPMAPIIKAAIADVPESAKVSATNTVGAQLAHREHLYAFPNGIGEADYIFILEAKEGTLEWQRNHVQAEGLETDPRYEKFEQQKNFTAYRKR